MLLFVAAEYLALGLLFIPALIGLLFSVTSGARGLIENWRWYRWYVFLPGIMAAVAWHWDFMYSRRYNPHGSYPSLYEPLGSMTCAGYFIGLFGIWELKGIRGFAACLFVVQQALLFFGALDATLGTMDWF